MTWSAGARIEIGSDAWQIEEVLCGKDNEAWTFRAHRDSGEVVHLWMGSHAWARDVQTVFQTIQPDGLPRILATFEGADDTVFEITAPPKGTAPLRGDDWQRVPRASAVAALQKFTTMMGLIHEERGWLQGVKRREIWLDYTDGTLFLMSLGRLHVTRKPAIEAAWRDMRIVGELAYEAFAQETYPGGHQMAAILQDKSVMEGTPILFPGLPQLLAGCVSPYGDLAYVDTSDLAEGLEQIQIELDRPLTFVVGSASTVGNYLFRKNNQDSCGHLVANSICGSRKVSLGFFCVADGIGGIQDGERASRVAVETATQSFARAWSHYGAAYIEKWAPELAKAIAKVVGQRLAVEGELRPNNNRGGTTFSGMVVSGNRLGVCHVGDSRIVLIRNGVLVQLTHDHTLANILIELGELTPAEALKNDVSQRTISRFLSTSAEVEYDRVDGFGVEAQELGSSLNERGLTVERGDLFILTSDGTHGEIDESEILKLAQVHRDSPQDLSEALVQNAIDLMGRDNATALIVRMD